jgi:hypothetical protein
MWPALLAFHCFHCGATGGLDRIDGKTTDKCGGYKGHVFRVHCRHVFGCLEAFLCAAYLSRLPKEWCKIRASVETQLQASGSPSDVDDEWGRGANCITRGSDGCMSGRGPVATVVLAILHYYSEIERMQATRDPCAITVCRVWYFVENEETDSLRREGETGRSGE